MARIRECPAGDGSAGAGDRRRYAGGKGRNARLLTPSAVSGCGNLGTNRDLIFWVTEFIFQVEVARSGPNCRRMTCLPWIPLRIGSAGAAKMAARKEPALQYIPSVAKALEVILWLASERSGIDFYHLVKASFFGDKYHITKFGRPLAGDIYKAAWFGPLPQVIYGLLRHEPMEMLALGNGGPLPFRVDSAHCVYPERGPNLDKLSESDIEALTHGLSEVDGKSFDDLLKETHRDPAYRNARSGVMDYRDFIPDGDKAKREKIAYLEEVANDAVF
jgi:hypothetical protein